MKSKQLPGTFRFAEGIFICNSLNSLQLVKIHRSSGVYDLDGLVAQIVRKIDGKTSLQTIVEYIASQNNINIDDLAAETTHLVEYLLAENLIKIQSDYIDMN